MADDIVEELWVERQIRQQMNRYCRAVDRFDAELWRSCWHEDGTLDYRASGMRGMAKDLSVIMTRGHEPWESHSHQITGARIVVKGDRAVSETFNSNILRGFPDDAGRVVDNHYRGRYLDYWSFRHGRWAMDHRHTPGGSNMWRQTVAESRVGKMNRRGPDDPSYELFASLGGESGDQIEILLAEREIRQQMNNYARAVDRFDVELWQSVWHPDGTIDYPDYELSGAAGDVELARQMTLGHGFWASHMHQLTTSLIEINGDRAVSETGASAILRNQPDASGRVVDDHYRGRYLDRWSRRDGRWAIDHRLMIEDFMWKQDADAAWLGEHARRDRDDPSYDLLASLDGGPRSVV